MSVGFVTDKGTIDRQIGSISGNLFLWARQATDLQTYLAAIPDTDLETLGYTPEDVALLKSAANDMGKLAQVFRGEVDQTPAYDFRTFTGRVAGLQI